jgi:hypothetical protein
VDTVPLRKDHNIVFIYASDEEEEEAPSLSRFHLQYRKHGPKQRVLLFG